MPARIDIPKEELKKLYWEKGLSTKNIGFSIGLSKGCVLNNMHRQKIKLRNKNIAKNIALKSKLPDEFNTNTYSFQYLFGVAYGDGCVSNRRLVMYVKDLDFIKKFIEHGKKLGFKPTLLKNRRKNKYPLWGTSIYNKAFIELLKKQKLEITHGFINGFIDSEACVVPSSKQMSIYNNDKKILHLISDFLSKKHMNNHLYVRKARQPTSINPKKCNIKKYNYQLTICGKQNLINFHKHFHFSIKRKQDKLDTIVKSYR